MKKLIFLGVLWFLTQGGLLAQNHPNPAPIPPISDYSVDARNSEITLYSYNPKYDPSVKKEDMPYFWFPLLTSRNNDLIRGGLRATDVGTEGFAEVSIYIYDEDETDGLGELIYQARTSENTESTSDWVEDPSIVEITSPLDDSYTIDVETTDTQQLLASGVFSDGMKEFYEQSLYFCAEPYLEEYGKTKQDYEEAMAKLQKQNIAVALGGGCLTGGTIGAIAGSVEPGLGTAAGAVSGCALGTIFGGISYVVGLIFGDDPPPVMMNCLADQFLLPIPPVVIKLHVKDANLRALKLPTAGEVDLTEYFPILNTPFYVALTTGGETTTISYPQDDTDIPVLDMVMGDELQIEVKTPYQGLEPEIYGLPKVWPAAFAGDLMFYCDPNYGPGSINPHIGLDSRVHTLQLRPFPPDYVLYENWEEWIDYGAEDGKDWNVFQWTYTAEREMDATKTKYEPFHKWEKKHFKKDGTLMNQRQNQKEGLNMKFLNHWKAWKSTSFRGYDGNTGKAKYMMGFDDDELAYFNHPWKESGETHPFTGGGGIAKLETLQWKQLLEGDAKYDATTGFPSENHPVNMMVNAFRRFQSIEHSLKYKRFEGYEIQDNGTNSFFPNGIGSTLGNNKHPGLVTVNYGGRDLKFKLNVTSPLGDSYQGFYDTLAGTDAPGNAEKSVPFHVHGVKDLDDSEHDKYKLNYYWMDRLGEVSFSSISVSDIIEDQEHRNMTWLQWIKHMSLRHGLYSLISFEMESAFDLERPTYSWVTATYQRTEDSEPVVIAGKELNQIFLMFCGIKTLNGLSFPEGKGHGSKIWKEDFRNASGGEFDIARKFGNSTKYTKKYSKTYVLSKGDRVNFTTFDGDPHRLDNNEEEWYLSNRSMAKRVKNNLLWNGTDPALSYLKYYIGSEGSSDANLTLINEGRSGKDLRYTFDTVGTYDMRVSYRGASDLYIKIKVVDYPVVDDIANPPMPGGASKGIVTSRSLTSDEIRWLGNVEINGLVYEVSDVKTKFLFQDGHRSYDFESEGNKLANRWSKYNDYADGYVWYNSVGGIMVNGSIPGANNVINYRVNAFMTSYQNKMADRSQTWMWKDWANHYSSVWKGKLKTEGSTEDGLPPYTPENTVTRLYDLPDLDNSFGDYIDAEIFGEGKYTERRSAPWQYVIPLVSTTLYHGLRQRTNPSCIYSLGRVFDNGNGAFNGNPPNPEDPSSIQAPDTSDEDKNKQDFYYNLLNNRILIVSASTSLNDARVYQRLYNGETETYSEKFITEVKSSWFGKRAIKENSEQEIYGQGNVYPNASNGLINLNLSEEWLQDSGYFTLHVYDLSGKSVFLQTIPVSQEVTINLTHLPAGVYVVERIKGSMSHTDKIIINK